MLEVSATMEMRFQNINKSSRKITIKRNKNYGY